MAKRGKIDELYDFPALQAQHQKVLELIGDFVKTANETKPIAIKLEGAEKTKDIMDGIKQIAAASDKLAESVNKGVQEYTKLLQAQKSATVSFADSKTILEQYNGTLDNNIKIQQKYKDKLDEIKQKLKDLEQFKGLGGDAGNKIADQVAQLTKEQLLLKQAASEVSITIRAQIKEMTAAATSNDEMAARLGLLRNQYRALAAEEKKSEFGQKLLADIQLLDKAVKEDDALIGNFQRNVGNYAGSLAEPFRVLTEQISKLKTEQSGLQDLRTSNPIGFKIGDQERLNDVTSQLQKLQEVQKTGFVTTGNYASQINTLKQAYDELQKSGTQSTSFLEQFQAAIKSQKLPEYSGSFKGAFDVLKKELDEVRKKLMDPALQGKQLESLQKEEALLSQLTENLSQNFTSTRQELKALQEAAKKLGIDFGATNVVFHEFASEVGGAKDEVDDLQGIIKQNSSDTRFLDGAIGAVNGLAGAYGAAQGAAELFGDGNEDLQKKMVKLQALLTIINGLQAVQNALQTEGAAAQLIVSARLGLVNAAKSIEAALFTASAVAVQAETLALVENAAATEAGAVAHAENAAATAASAVAMEGEAVAATAATGATNTFRTALLASGIGAIILGFVAAVVFLVSKVNEWVSSNSRALSLQNDLADSTKSLNDALTELTNAYNEADQAGKRYLQNQLDFSSAAGEGAIKQFALKKQLYQEDKRLADLQVQSLGATNTQQAQLLSSIESLQAKKILVTQQLQKSIAEKDETGTEAAKKVLESYDKSLQSIQSLYQAGEKARQDSYLANKNLAQTEIEEQKFNADEQRKLVLQSVQIESDLIRAKNESILSNDRSSLAARLAALKGNAEAQRKVIEAQKADVLSDPGASSVDKTLAIRRAAEEEQKITISTADAINKIKEDYRLRDLVADDASRKSKISGEIEINKQIAGNQVFTFEQRVTALRKYLEDEKALLDNSYKLKLQQAGISDKEIEALSKDKNYRVKSKKITDKELLALQAGYENEVLRLTIEGNTAAGKVIKDEFSKRKELQDTYLADVQQQFALSSLQQSSQYAKEIIDLNEALSKKRVSLRKYNLERTRLDAEYAKQNSNSLIASLQEQLKAFTVSEEGQLRAKEKVEKLKQDLAGATTDDEKKSIGEKLELALDELKFYTDSVNQKIALEKQLADAQVKLSEAATAKRIELQQTLLDKQRQFLQQASEAFFSSIGGQYDVEKERIDEQIAKLEEKKNKDTDVANQTIVNAGEREKQIKIIEVREAANKEALEKKKRKLDHDKAQFEKLAAIFNIGIQTIQDTAKIKAQAAVLLANPVTAPLAPLALAQIPFVIASGALSAGLIAARSVPKYFMGTDNHPGGLAIVGDGGVSEYAVTPDGTITKTPAVPTLMDLPAHSKVYKDEFAFFDALMRMGVSQTSGANEKQPEYDHWRQLSGAIQSMKKDVVNAIKNAPQPIIKSTDKVRDWVHSNGGSAHYLN